jgi:hypothetical protein
MSFAARRDDVFAVALAALLVVDFALGLAVVLADAFVVALAAVPLIALAGAATELLAVPPALPLAGRLPLPPVLVAITILLGLIPIATGEREG